MSSLVAGDILEFYAGYKIFKSDYPTTKSGPLIVDNQISGKMYWLINDDATFTKLSAMLSASLLLVFTY